MRVYRTYSNWCISYQPQVFSANIIIFYMLLWQNLLHCSPGTTLLFVWLPLLQFIPLFHLSYWSTRIGSNMLLSQSLPRLASCQFFTIYLHLSSHSCWPLVTLSNVADFLSPFPLHLVNHSFWEKKNKSLFWCLLSNCPIHIHVQTVDKY